jgi:hypothetical protein
MATSKGYTATATGTDYWVATYNGDKNNKTVSCGTADEPVSISPSGPVAKGDFATVGFWNNKNGQAVINSFNGGPTATLLGNWLATNFPNLFGTPNPYTSAALASFGTTTFAGLTNAQVATVYANVFGGSSNGVAANTYVQAFAVALGAYADDPSLGYNATAAQAGFQKVTGGGGNLTFGVGGNGAAFPGLGSNPTVFQILGVVNASFNPTTGLFYGGDPTLTNDANIVLNGINEKGDIK